MKINKEVFDKALEMVCDAELALKKVKVLQEELTSDFFMQLELKSFEEVNEHWYVQSYNRSSMYAHITGDYLEQLEKTIKELNELLLEEAERTRKKADASTSTEEI